MQARPLGVASTQSSMFSVTLGLGLWVVGGSGCTAHIVGFVQLWPLGVAST